MIKISVVTAVFNSIHTVEQSINSVLSQTHPAVESIVIDGGSIDGSLSLLNLYRDRLGVIISEPDKGIYDALNKGINHSSGDVIGFLHSDDVFQNNDVLAKVASVFEDPNIDAVYGNLVYVRYDDVNSVIRYWNAGNFDPKLLESGWMPPHPTFYVRRSIYESLGGFNLRYSISSDYDSVLKILRGRGVNVEYIPEVLVRMRIGGISNRSLRTLLKKSLEDFEVIKNNKLGGFNVLLRKNLRKISQFFIKK